METASSEKTCGGSRGATAQPHIRPKKRVTVGGGTKAITQQLPALSNTEKVLKWVNTPHGNKAADPSEASLDSTTVSNHGSESRRPKSILKKSKYKLIAPDGTTVEQLDDKSASSAATAVQQESISLATSGFTSSAIRPVQDLVVERKRRPRRKVANINQNQESRAQPSQPSHHQAIEGFTPSTENNAEIVKTTSTTRSTSTPNSQESTTSGKRLTIDGDAMIEDENHAEKQNDDDDDDGNTEPLVFGSLADLMEKAGTLPPNNPNESPAVVEAQLDFACMEPSAFEKYQEDSVQEQHEIFLGTDDPFSQQSSASEDESDSDEASADEEDDDNADDLWGILGDRNEEPTVPVEPRAFMKLWNALSQWVTPEAVSYLEHLMADAANPASEYNCPDWVPQVDRSDLGASRCAGIMSLMRIHTKKCLEQLNESFELTRTAERRVGELLRCFNYSRPTPRMDSALARGLTCILLDMVLVEGWSRRGDLVPTCCRSLDMTFDEYHYLTRSAILRFKFLPNQD